MPLVLLTDPIDPEERRRLDGAAETRVLRDDAAGALAAAAREADAIIVRRALPPELPAACPRLRILVRHGAGLDFIPVPAASAAGVAVANTPGVNARSVAEAAFALLLAGARDVARRDRGVRAGEWAALRAAALGDREVHGRDLGLVGFGHVGREIARIARCGFGMTVRAARRRPGGAHEHAAFAPLAEVLARSDHVVVACPLTEETRGLIGAAELALMRPGASLINVARGAVVDEAALAAALDAGALSFAAADVFARQPPRPDDPLLGAARVTLTPHVAGVTADSMRRMSRAAVDETLRALAGERPLNLVNPEAWLAIAARWRALGRATPPSGRFRDG